MRLKYEHYNYADTTISIDLHNGYSVFAITGYNPSDNAYYTSLWLKDNSLDTMRLIDDADGIKFYATKNTINSAVLKKVSEYLDEGFFEKYIERYEYEILCSVKGNELIENERYGVV